ncbi:RNA polymerase sigma factor [Rhizobium sp. L1K21]|uniref:RNA polymerase sigma factor n=1 Tax=Rhizobium sp. L1K21 TaxID=2954933 RepID=UPI002092C76E|nr:RNA polymerase sigma factor [Rhizobium sp. L1K21]MCO6185410.1 RNA polymerase sigma factor [Rhizobium sp. L1K21]
MFEASVSRNESAELVRFLPRMRRFAITLTRNANDADDLVQEACEKTITKAHLRPPQAGFESWVYTMMRNMWIDEVRKRKVRLGKGNVDFSEQDELNVSPSGEDAIYIAQVKEMIQSMPEGLASVFLLVNVEGHSYREAADILGIPIGTVMSRLSTARLRLAEMVGQPMKKRA